MPYAKNTWCQSFGHFEKVVVGQNGQKMTDYLGDTLGVRDERKTTSLMT